MTDQKTAIIIGAGPAGLTTALELLRRTSIKPIVLEATDYLGGIARTANYKGNRIDIGGHRFFSKSDRVMEWWLDIMPIEQRADPSATIGYRQQKRQVASGANGPNPDKTDRVMLVRERKSRIYFLRKFFNYPIQFSADTIGKLGLGRTARIGVSYAKAVALPYKNEVNLEQFLINRFGRQLYLTFFKSYTEKVWGEKCSSISSEWGAQRIKGLSITKALTHFLKSMLPHKKDVAQKNVETSLIEQFLYPKLGPGQMWELVTEEIKRLGGEVRLEQSVTQLQVEGNLIQSVDVRDGKTHEIHRLTGDYFFSTMPVKELIQSMQAEIPANVREVSEGLLYRDFITVGLLVKDLRVRDDKNTSQPIKDNWIYIQEPDVKVGRLQIFNNWSPHLVADPTKTWVGLEYFCYEGDELWRMSDEALKDLGREEMSKIGIIESSAVLDATVIRMKKTYPAYFGTYERFAEIRHYLDAFENLFLIGRNGMHKYNNQDHSMLTAMTAVDNIAAGRVDKENIWAVNTEQEYHEKKR